MTLQLGYPNNLLRKKWDLLLKKQLFCHTWKWINYMQQSFDVAFIDFNDKLLIY